MSRVHILLLKSSFAPPLIDYFPQIYTRSILVTNDIKRITVEEISKDKIWSVCSRCNRSFGNGIPISFQYVSDIIC